MSPDRLNQMDSNLLLTEMGAVLLPPMYRLEDRSGRANDVYKTRQEHP